MTSSSLPHRPASPPSVAVKIVRDTLEQHKTATRKAQWAALKPFLLQARESLSGTSTIWGTSDATYVIRFILSNFYLEASKDQLADRIKPCAPSATAAPEQWDAVQEDGVPLHLVPESARNLKEFEGSYFPWYLCPYLYKGQRHDPFEDHRALYSQWAAAAKTDPMKAEIFWALCAENPAFFIHHVLTITTAAIEKKFDHWFGHQKMLWAAFSTQWYNNQIVRLIVLKPRQVGLTTWCSALDFWFTLFTDNVKSVVMSNSADSSGDIISRCAAFATRVNRLWEPKSTRPVLNKNNTDGVTYELDKRKKDQVGVVRNSSLKCKTARSQTSPRGWVMQLLHGSEVVDWGTNGHDTWTALYAGIHTVPGTIVILESTGQPGSFMEDLWKKSEKGENEFDPVFISWKEMEEYSAALPLAEEAYRKTLDDNEKELEQRGFTLEQLHWRRTIGIPSKANGDKAKFCQEYPSTPAESFLASSRTIYDTQVVEEQRNRIQSTPWGLPLAVGVYEFQAYQACFIARQDGTVTIWENPQPETQYIIGIDPSKGLAGDFFSVQVFRVDAHDGLVQVAKAKDCENPRRMIEQAYCLALKYNNAFIIHESNKDDLLIQTLIEQYDYENIYREEKTQQGYRVTVWRYGYWNNGPTKEELIRKGKEWFDGRKLQLRDAETLNQFAYMVKDPDNFHAFGPARGKDHDDDHMAAILCVEGATSQQLGTVGVPRPRVAEPKVVQWEEGRYYDRGNSPRMNSHWDSDVGEVDY